jgi:hypothetical protein
MGLESTMLPHPDANNIKIDKKHKKASKKSLTAEILIVICSDTHEINIFKKKNHTYKKSQNVFKEYTKII